jgi:hypothetical protein
MSKKKPAAARRSHRARKSTPRARPNADPRLRPGFQPEHFPLCDGTAPPLPDTTDRVQRRQIEFLAAYYRLNQLHARLQAIRHSSSHEDEKVVLREIQNAIRDRDTLEDRYEPEGFLAEPLMQGAFCSSIRFTHAQSHHFHQPLVSSRFTLSISLPPPGVDIETWVERRLATAFPDLSDPSSGTFAEFASEASRRKTPGKKPPDRAPISGRKR